MAVDGVPYPMADSSPELTTLVEHLPTEHKCRATTLVFIFDTEADQIAVGGDAERSASQCCGTPRARELPRPKVPFQVNAGNDCGYATPSIRIDGDRQSVDSKGAQTDPRFNGE